MSPQKNYRYPGTRPFQASDRGLFFGRANDIERLTQLILLEEQVVLYSKSGLGKTSLLNAGVIPEIEQEVACRVITIRFGSFSVGNSITPLQKLHNTLTDLHNALNTQQRTNAQQLLQKVTNPVGPASNSLWYAFKTLSVNEADMRPFVLIFDQFEELFTYPETDIEAFTHEFAQVLAERMPLSIRKFLQAKMGADRNYLSRADYHTVLSPMAFRVVFSIRSDKMSLLNRLKNHFPKILSKTYELEPLSTEQARDAIVKPSLLTDKTYLSPQFTLTEAVQAHILDFLSKGNVQRVEAFQLQIVCQHIENMVLEQNLRLIDVAQLGNIEAIYENFYGKLIRKLPENEQEKARLFIEEGLIFEDDERRLSLYEGQIFKQYSIARESLQYLVNTHLLRTETNPNGGFVYELSHDTLIQPILQAKKERLKQVYLQQLAAEKQLELERIKQEGELERQRLTQESLIIAQRTLTSIMSDYGQYTKQLRSVLVFDRPKNIINGDFYFFKQVDDVLYIGVFDATGSGVPGALLRMMGYSKLNELIKDNTTPVNEILHQLRDTVMQTFLRSDNLATVGFDGALCAIHLKSGYLEYSGAKIPLFYWDKDHLNTIKATPIAIIYNPLVTERDIYTVTRVDIAPDNAFYLATDGFQKQEQADSVKKFQKKRLIALLEQAHSLPTDAQLALLEDALTAWKKDRKQSDDILVLGFKL